MIWRERIKKERKRIEEEGEEREMIEKEGEKRKRIEKEGEERVVALGVAVEKAAEEPE